jgi:hypothetical protein
LSEGQTLQGSGPGVDTSFNTQSPYFGYGNYQLSGQQAVLSLQIEVRAWIPEVNGPAAPVGTKVQCVVRTPTGKVVFGTTKVNDGKPDPNESIPGFPPGTYLPGSPLSKTMTWTWTPKLMSESSGSGHPAARWLPGTYVYVFTVGGRTVGGGSWHQ